MRQGTSRCGKWVQKTAASGTVYNSDSSGSERAMALLPAIPRVKLGSQGLEVSTQGLGCMGMSALYGPAKPDEEMIEIIRHAVELGITFFDTSDVYGPHTNEVLLGKAIKGIQDGVQIATKFGATPPGSRGRSGTMRGDPEYVRAVCEASLKWLEVDYIDLYYQHRVDTKVPIEVTIGEMKKLVEEGKVKYLGLRLPLRFGALMLCTPSPRSSLNGLSGSVTWKTTSSQPAESWV